MNIPAELKYTKNDEWLRIEGNTGTVGITDFAQDQLSDIVFIEFNVSPGDVIAKGASIATVESVKAASDVYSPVSGKVTEVNNALADGPEAINSDPYGKAWMVKIELSAAAEAGELLDSAAYEKSAQERGS
ncbi:MAG: glycine cleavage system protein GcvH [Anaerolineae bacterium]|nr:MAG: glycine cleavage system protein GcvH [Anaerolineae bacterium]